MKPQPIPFPTCYDPVAAPARDALAGVGGCLTKSKPLNSGLFNRIPKVVALVSLATFFEL
jgi:hypothetical protein